MKKVFIMFGCLLVSVCNAGERENAVRVVLASQQILLEISARVSVHGAESDAVASLLTEASEWELRVLEFPTEANTTAYLRYGNSVCTVAIPPELMHRVHDLAGKQYDYVRAIGDDIEKQDRYLAFLERFMAITSGAEIGRYGIDELEWAFDELQGAIYERPGDN